MIKNVLFDMGNVLIEWQPELFLQRLGVSNKEDIDTIMNNAVRKKYWHDYDLGTVTKEELIKKSCNGLPKRLHKYVKLLVNNWHDVSHVIEGMPEYTRYLKKKGIKIYILSNAGKNQPYYIRKFPYSHFDGKCVSAYYGVGKPNKELYEICLKKFNLKAEECVFTDDMQANVDAANKLGIKAYLFKNTEKLKKDLKL